MKNLVWAVVIVGVVVGAKRGYEYAQARMVDQEARTRVESMLGMLAEGDEQTAMCQWARGEMFLPAAELGRHLDGFAAFARRHGLEKGMRWSLDAVELATDGATVAVTVDGDWLSLWVVPGQPIEVRE